jgi:hypothetical protein
LPPAFEFGEVAPFARRGYVRKPFPGSILRVSEESAEVTHQKVRAMSRIDHLQDAIQFNRIRTLGLLEKIEQEPDPQLVLAWRPGITEEIFATERLLPEKPGHWLDLWPRFRGGSTPDDNVPTPAQIREVLNGGREHLLATLSTFRDDQLGWIPPALAQRQLTLLDVLHIIAWHEGHHQGQAHITLNLFKASQAQ